MAATAKSEFVSPGGLGGLDAPRVHAIIVLDGAGKRLAGKYYDPAKYGAAGLDTLKKQTEFEAKLYKKAKGVSMADSEVVLLEDHQCVVRRGDDVFFIAVASQDESELIVASVVNTLYEAVSQLLKMPTISRRALLEHLVLLLLALDEIVEGGVVFETDPENVVDRVKLKGAVPEALSAYEEMTVSSMFSLARDMVAKQLGGGADEERYY